MNVLFLSLIDFQSFEQRNIYSDLLREFIKNGHKVYCISPVERRTGQTTHVLRFGESRILKLRIGNIQKTNVIEKGISTLQIESLFIKGIKKYFSDVQFDFVLYATPPVTFAKVIRFVKKRDGAKSYLMLKDIFPQNSVDIGMLEKTGIKAPIYHYFRHKEKKLYALSDRIGCMSAANASYVLRHNPQLSPEKVEICPNCIEVCDMALTNSERMQMRQKYGIPADKQVFVYGGNLGKPQDVPFVVECLKACADLKDVYFVIAGTGTDRYVLEDYLQKEKPSNVKLLDLLPKEEYDRMIACCDVGLIFLDYRFTIPNFPSRLLPYMQAGLPVLCCTDGCTDIGDAVERGGFGWQCRSDDAMAFRRTVERACAQKSGTMSEAALEYLCTHYSASVGYEIVSRFMEK